MTQLVCRTCNLQIPVVGKDGEVVIEYDTVNWKARCTSPNIDSPTQCPVIGPKILALLGEIGKKPGNHCT